MKQRIKIGTFETIYSLFLGILLFNHKEWDIIYIKNFKPKWKKNKKAFFHLRSNSKYLAIILIFIQKLYFRAIFHNKEIEIYGQDHTGIGNILVGMGKFYLIEDGLMSYQDKNDLKNKYFKLKELIGINLSLGRHKNVKKIYLTGLASIPEEIKDKAEIINLKELWDRKTLEEQNEILDIFSFDLKIKETIKGRSIILFTQPLSEDNIIMEEEKIKLYSKIIKKYPKERLVIKTHPRERTNYKDIFKEYLVLDNPFPFEILNLLDIKFNKAVTLFSTAALGLGKEVEVDFYGTEVHQKILQKFGSCNNIMERNCFLKEE